MLPLGLAGSLHSSPAWGYRGPLDDLLALGRELLAPTLVAPETLAEATSVQFPGLAGVLPGWGRMEPNDWGLAFELRDAKSPHWTGARNSPRTFGHFGAAGTFLWVDPDAGLACGVLTDREFGEWAIEAWPAFSDAVLAEAGEPWPVANARGRRVSRRSRLTRRPDPRGRGRGAPPAAPDDRSPLARRARRLRRRALCGAQTRRFADDVSRRRTGDGGTRRRLRGRSWRRRPA